MVRLVCAFLVLNIFVVLLVTQAPATTFILAEPAALLSISDVVVVGSVQSIRSVNDAGVVQTNVTVGIEEGIKGTNASQLTVVEPGGLIGEQRRWVFGAPTFFTGERVLLFLRRNARQQLTTTFLAMGKFSVVTSSSGTEFAVRNLGDAQVLGPHGRRLERSSPVSSYELRSFLKTLRAGSGGRGDAGGGTPTALAAQGSRWQDNFTFSGPPRTRWFQADTGAPIEYHLSEGGDATLGEADSIAAADAALAAWSQVECADLHLVDAGVAPPSSFNVCDGQTEITFNDPADEIDDPVGCSGVLAIGGVCADGHAASAFNGLSFFPITEADVVVNNGFAGCWFWNPTSLAELLTHEVGHTLGLAHSSENPAETDPSLRDATMYYAAHFDGRGASLRSDDIAGVCALYPSGRTGVVTLRRFAVVFDSTNNLPNDRLVVDGFLDLDDGQFNPQTTPLIVDVHAAGASALRMTVQPGSWRVSPSGKRFLYRSASATSLTTVILARTESGGKLRFSIRVRGVDLSAAQSDPVMMSFTGGQDSATQMVTALRTQSRSRVYP